MKRLILLQRIYIRLNKSFVANGYLYMFLFVCLFV